MARFGRPRNGQTGAAVPPTIGVSHHAEASWQDPDGTTHDYSSDTDVVLIADAPVAFGAAGSLTRSGADEGWSPGPANSSEASTPPPRS